VVMGLKFPWRLSNGCGRPAIWIQENADCGKSLTQRAQRITTEF
jgi:hypothetical protein